MLDWSTITPRDATRRFLTERARLGSAVSTAGLDQDGRLPRNRPSQDWEDLIRLFAPPVDPLAIDVLEVKVFGWAGVHLQEQFEYPKGLTREEWEQANPGERGELKHWWEWQSIPLTDRQVAQVMRIDVDEVKRLIHDAEMVVEHRIMEKRAKVRVEERTLVLNSTVRFVFSVAP